MPVADYVLDLENVQDPVILPDGSEVELTLKKLYSADTEKGKAVKAVLEPQDQEEEVQAVFEHFRLPTLNDEIRTQNFLRRNLKKFLEAFDINFESFYECLGSDDFSEFIGNSAWAILGVSADEGYDPSNNVKRYVPSQ